MDIYFKNKKTGKEFNEGARLERIHGAVRAKKIRLSMTALRAAESLYDFWPPMSGPERCHELTEGKRSGQLSVDLDHPDRLIFIPAHDPPPRSEDGGLDWKRVTAITIIEIADTHGT